MHGVQRQPCLPLVLTGAQIDARPTTYGLFPWVDHPADPIATALRLNLGLLDVTPAAGGSWAYTWE